MKTLLALIAAGLFTVACGDTAAPAASAPTRSPVSAPSTSPSVMTKDSGTDGVPLPSDAKAKPDGSGGVEWDSSLGTIAEYTTFYRDWGPKHGWTIEPKYSFTDPTIGVAKQAGYGTITTLCVLNSSPVRTVIILVHSPNGKTDQGKLTTIAIIDSPNESSCP